MPQFMDVHHGMTGITADDLKAAHDADLAVQGEERVVFKEALGGTGKWLVHCLSEGPSAEAIQRVHQRTGHPADEIHPVPLQV